MSSPETRNSRAETRVVPAPAPGPTPLQTLLGGEDIPVDLADGSTETVRVRQVPIREYPRLLELQLDDPALCEFLCGKPAGWADGVTFDGIERIIESGDRLNLDFFGRWLRRRIARQARLLPESAASPLPSPTSPAPSGSPSMPPRP